MLQDNDVENKNVLSLQKSISDCVFITTQIDGEKQYIRRLKHIQNGNPIVYRTCKSITKALNFKTDERANKIIKAIGLGYKTKEKMTKDLTLCKINIVEENLRRFKTLVEVDLTQNNEVLVYCLIRAEIEIKDLIAEYSSGKPILSQVFDFQKGDIIEFCNENYFVIENNGSQGVVNPFGENYYVRFFQWQLQGEKAKFVRKPTKNELERLGLLN